MGVPVVVRAAAERARIAYEMIATVTRRRTGSWSCASVVVYSRG